jgi:hypothetical protein
MTAETHLSQHFMDLRLPPAAAEWLLGVWNAIQVLDDAADNDPIDRKDLHRAIYDLFVDLPSNPFFVHNAVALLPALSLMVLKWKASDDAERAECADARSFVWRAGYYDVVLAVVVAAHGRAEALAVARGVLSLYGETLDEYLKEFPPCQIR